MPDEQLVALGPPAPWQIPSWQPASDGGKACRFTTPKGWRALRDGKPDGSQQGGHTFGLKGTEERTQRVWKLANGLAQRQRLTLLPLSRNSAKWCACYQRQSRCPLEPVLGCINLLAFLNPFNCFLFFQEYPQVHPFILRNGFIKAIFTLLVSRRDYQCSLYYACLIILVYWQCSR